MINKTGISVNTCIYMLVLIVLVSERRDSKHSEKEKIK